MSQVLTPTPELIAAYQRMADLTKPKCGGEGCGIVKPGGCCERFYCEMTQAYAREVYGVELEFVDPDAKVPFLRDNACSVAPHLRPACAMHVCKVNSLGFDPKDPEWTERYFKLRGEIEVMEDSLRFPEVEPPDLSELDL